MIIGVPKEIKNNENRVGLTPAGVAELRKHGHSLLVQAGAGEGSGFADGEYEQVLALEISSLRSASLCPRKIAYLLIKALWTEMLRQDFPDM